MIALADVKAHLRVDHADEDAKIQGYIDAAISTFEALTNRTLVAAADPLPDPLGNAMHITKSVEQGALMLVGHWYANVESVAVGVSAAELPMATRSLWLPHRWINI